LGLWEIANGVLRERHEAAIGAVFGIRRKTLPRIHLRIGIYKTAKRRTALIIPAISNYFSGEVPEAAKVGEENLAVLGMYTSEQALDCATRLLSLRNS
jgi:hypothetical protein